MTAKMSFFYGLRPSYYHRLKENALVAAQLAIYIREVKEVRATGRPTFYQDEISASKIMTPIKVWVDECGNGGLKVPSGKGEHSIIFHIGGSIGFVNGAKLIFRDLKSVKDADYHTGMNATCVLTGRRSTFYQAYLQTRCLLLTKRPTIARSLQKANQYVLLGKLRS